MLTIILSVSHQMPFKKGKIVYYVGDLRYNIFDQDFYISNVEKIVEKGLSIVRNMRQLWDRRDFDDKRELQSLVFPDGILYNKEKDRVRTPRVNSVFASIPILTRLLEEKEIEPLMKNDSISTKVEVRRIVLCQQ